MPSGCVSSTTKRVGRGEDEVYKYAYIYACEKTGAVPRDWLRVWVVLYERGYGTGCTREDRRGQRNEGRIRRERVGGTRDDVVHGGGVDSMDVRVWFQ